MLPSRESYALNGGRILPYVGLTADKARTVRYVKCLSAHEGFVRWIAASDAYGGALPCTCTPTKSIQTHNSMLFVARQKPKPIGKPRVLERSCRSLPQNWLLHLIPAKTPS